MAFRSQVLNTAQDMAVVYQLRAVAEALRRHRAHCLTILELQYFLCLLGRTGNWK